MFGPESEFAVATPPYRAATHTAMGWLNRALAQFAVADGALSRNRKVSFDYDLEHEHLYYQPRWFHSLWASRQT